MYIQIIVNNVLNLIQHLYVKIYNLVNSLILSNKLRSNVNLKGNKRNCDILQYIQVIFIKKHLFFNFKQKFANQKMEFK